ncbi:Ribonuclease H-like superfamily [Sesbania bispinosa]|nr:Ribonuclease H-like superfamily [Sesbania bispinosa]
MHAMEFLKDGFSMNLGCGNSSIWYDWTGMGRLCDLLPYVHISDTHLHVRDLWNNGTWSLSSLATPLSEELVSGVSNIRIPLVPSEDDDGWSWGHGTYGTYSCKEGYNWLRLQNNNSPPTRPWCWVWQIQAPEKVRFFLWLSLHNSIPTKAILHRRGMVGDDLCLRCLAHTETVLHCLRDCTHARHVWAHMGFRVNDHLFATDLFVWFTTNIRGAYNPASGEMGICGVMRNSEGSWQWGFSARCGRGSILEAKLSALKAGLEFAWERNHRFVHCESDS